MKKKKWAALLLSGLLLCTIQAAALAVEDSQPLPDSILYYGEVREVTLNEDGTIGSLHMVSARSGEFIMKVSDKTFWIDSGAGTASDPSTLKEGERLYVFHSPAATRSLPPQSAAFAVVRNIPQDAGCAQYHRVEAVEEQDGRLRIVTNDGGLYLFADKETIRSSYTGDPMEGLESIRTGDHIMTWYSAVAESYPEQAYLRRIMVLNQADGTAALTRASFAVLLYTSQGSPAAGSGVDFGDISLDADYAEALRWAVNTGLINGYGGGMAGPGDNLTREQMAVILWRQAGSPILMDYSGLSEYSDAEDISCFAQPALAWAHHKGLLSDGERLDPKGYVSQEEAEAALRTLSGQK